MIPSTSGGPPPLRPTGRPLLLLLLESVMAQQWIRKPRLSHLPSALSLLLTVTMRVGGDPILPSLNYPVFVYSPSSHQQQHQQSYKTPPPIPEEGFEVSQFHSQDDTGRVVFGYYSPDQSRMEARALDGSVRGSYSYIDPYGSVVKMQYWDEGDGFHVAGNLLPDGSPPYTPEVAAAREQHLKIYHQTLAATHQLIPQSDEGTITASSNNDASISINPFEDYLHKNTQEETPYEDDSISLENPEFLGSHTVFYEDRPVETKKPAKEEVEGEVDLGEDIDDELIEDGYENDEQEKDHFEFDDQVVNGRKEEYKNNYGVLYQKLKHSAKKNIKAFINDPVLDEEISPVSSLGLKSSSQYEENFGTLKEDYHVKEKDNTKTNKAIMEDRAFSKSETDEPEISENKNSGKILVNSPVGYKLLNSEVTATANPQKGRGFFYHFQHTIPRRMERIDDSMSGFNTFPSAYGV